MKIFLFTLNLFFSPAVLTFLSYLQFHSGLRGITGLSAVHRVEVVLDNVTAGVTQRGHHLAHSVQALIVNRILNHVTHRIAQVGSSFDCWTGLSNSKNPG